MTRSPLLAWIAVGLAIAACGGAAYASYHVERRKDAYIDAAAHLQQQDQQDMSSSRAHALVVDTRDDRATLTKAIPSDVISIADAIDAAGEKADVHVEVSNAVPEKAATQKSPIATVAFVVQGEGSFVHVARCVFYLGILPIPAQITQVEMERADDTGDSWRFSARVRALTTSTVSL